MTDLTTSEFLESLREPGKPCHCGREGEEHEFWMKYRTPTRWAVIRVHHWHSRTGIWWSSSGSRRYLDTEEKADAHIEKMQR